MRTGDVTLWFDVQGPTAEYDAEADLTAVGPRVLRQYPTDDSQFQKVRDYLSCAHYGDYEPGCVCDACLVERAIKDEGIPFLMRDLGICLDRDGVLKAVVQMVTTTYNTAFEGLDYDIAFELVGYSWLGQMEKSCDASCEPMCSWCGKQADIAAAPV